MLPRVTSRLYLNIWLVLMATVVLLTLSITAVWKYSHSSAPLATREVIVHNKLGELIGTAQTSPGRRQGEAMKFAVETTDGQTLHLLLPRPQLEVFIPWVNLKVDFSVTLIIVALIIALALYPVIRRLTLRLEALTHGVKRWGVGDLSARVNIEGKDEVAFLAANFNQGASHAIRPGSTWRPGRASPGVQAKVARFLTTVCTGFRPSSPS